VGDAPRVIVCAIEAAVYVVPTTKCAVFYVSKVDSTGQASDPAPTSTLVRALIGYYVDGRTRPVEAEHVWVQLFARAQGQYLFPNSKEWKGKRALGDTGLCAWWKRVLTRVVLDLDLEGMKVKMYYVLPGFSQDEAEHALRIATPDSASVLGQPTKGVRWEYGHPYSQTDIALPCPGEGEMKNLGHFIPSFDDDPKSRFMDEMAYTTDGDIKSPQKKRARTNTTGSTKGTTMVEEHKPPTTTAEEHKALGELGKVTVDEFWERMSFRQECVAGAVTGFFSVVVSSVPGRMSGESPLAPQAGQVAGQVHKRIMTTLLTGVEFSNFERAVKATETVEGAIRGLCEGIPEARRPRTPEPRERLLVPPSTPPRRGRVVAEVSPNPFPEPVTSLETYFSDIYGSIETRNAVQKREDEQKQGVAVTVLTVRRKKKVI